MYYPNSHKLYTLKYYKHLVCTKQVESKYFAIQNFIFWYATKLNPFFYTSQMNT